MSWFKRDPRPEVGDYQIVREELKNGSVAYEVQKYTYGYVHGELGWREQERFETLEWAKAYVNEEIGDTVASREVVWP